MLTLMFSGLLAGGTGLTSGITITSQDYTQSRPGVANTFPEVALATAHAKLEPILTPDQLKDRFLFGIPLVSRIRDPITGRFQIYTDDMILDKIEGGIETAESELKIDITPVKRREKHPFDRNLYESFGYMQLEHRPVHFIDKLSVTPSNNIDVFDVPLQWVEPAYLVRGQINIVPLTISFLNGGFVPTQGAGGAAFLSILGNKAWIPAYWQVEYTAGYKDLNVPRLINELIGAIVAQEIISEIAATFRVTSHSLGIDAMSQSVSTPGPAVFAQRYKELEEKKTRLIKKLKANYSTKIFSSHV